MTSVLVVEQHSSFSFWQTDWQEWSLQHDVTQMLWSDKSTPLLHLAVSIAIPHLVWVQPHFDGASPAVSDYYDSIPLLKGVLCFPLGCKWSVGIMSTVYVWKEAPCLLNLLPWSQSLYIHMTMKGGGSRGRRSLPTLRNAVHFNFMLLSQHRAKSCNSQSDDMLNRPLTARH